MRSFELAWAWERRCSSRRDQNSLQPPRSALTVDVRDLNEVFKRAHPRQRRHQAKKRKIAIK